MFLSCIEGPLLSGMNDSADHRFNSDWTYGLPEIRDHRHVREGDMWILFPLLMSSHTEHPCC